MRSSSYFKAIRRFFWIVIICFYWISCPVLQVTDAAFKTEEGGGYADTSSGFNYCVSECESDLNDCMESADGEKGGKQECKDDRNACDKKCFNYADTPDVSGKSNFEDWLRGIATGRLSDEEQLRKEKDATDKLDQNICRFDCNEVHKICLDPANEGEDAAKGKLRCEEAKNTCLQQC